MEHCEGDGQIIVETDAALVPGNTYDLLLKGVYAGCCENRPCVGDVLMFDARNIKHPMRAVDALEKKLL